MSVIQAPMPNTEKLFLYVKHGHWHNVSASSTRFVKNEYQRCVNDLQVDEKDYENLKLMIDYAEMGKYTEARRIMDSARTQYDKLCGLITGMRQGVPPTPKQASRQGSRQASRQSSRQASRQSVRQEVQNMNNLGERNNIYTPNYNNQDTYRGTPRLETPQSPSKEQNRNYQGRMETPPRSPMKNNVQNSRYDQDRMSQIGTPRSPLKQQNQAYHDYDSDDERRRRDQRHKENYQILRLHSPDKKYFGPRENLDETPRTPGGASARFDKTHPLYKHGEMDQQASHRDIWGLDFGDQDKEKARDSTYRQEYPKHDIESLERQDKLRYRSNFNSLAERETWFRDNVTLSDAESRKSSGVRRSPEKRYTETPDSNPHTALELAKKFKELYVHEWQDAYDEICKTFEPEKTVRHLLWIVTESSLIANEIASSQMRDLEKSAFGVMRTPGPEKDHPSEKGMPRNVGEAVPKSRTLLLRYRRQTADLSIPYVKEECRNQIGDALIEKSKFSRTFLSSNSRLVAYINKCAEITWLLCVQDPPIVLEYVTKQQEGARFNNDLYTQYTKPGMSFDYGVWPLLRQSKGGQVISKGIAQGI